MLTGAACATALTLGVIYALVIAPGSPYDEPAHFGNVEFYATRARMPALGEAGATYEAQMGPLYYALAAVVARVAGFGGVHASFYAVRLVGVLLLPIAVLLTRAIALQIAPQRRIAWLAPAILVGCNPIVLAIAASVQNDMLSMVISFAAILLTLKWSGRGQLSLERAMVLGIVVSAAVLTKATTVFLIIIIPLVIAAFDRQHMLRAVPAFLATVIVLTGWWWARNLILYGDLTAYGADARIYRFGGAHFDLVDVHVIGRWLYDAAAYYWFPSEYYRNVFTVPWVLRGLVAFISAAGATGLLLTGLSSRRASSDRAGVRNVVILGLFYLAAVTLAYAAYSPRYAFGSFVVFAVAVGMGFECLAERLSVVIRSTRRLRPAHIALLSAAIVGTIVCAANAYVLLRMHGIAPLASDALLGG